MADQATGVVEFRAGAAIARSFSVFFRNFIPFGLITLVLTSPTYVYLILNQRLDFGGATEFGATDGSGIIVNLVGVLLSYLVIAALVYGTLQDLRGERVSVGECFSQGLSRMFPVLGIALLTGIVTALAFLAFIIPGIFVAVMLWVTIPVAVVERRGFGSLPRSSELTSGYRWRVFFALVLLFVIILGFSVVIGMVAFGVLAATGTSDAGLTGVLVVDWVGSAMISMFVAILLAVSYHDLRVAKEGVDTDQIAAVFD